MVLNADKASEFHGFIEMVIHVSFAFQKDRDPKHYYSEFYDLEILVITTYYFTVPRKKAMRAN